ncbi:MAG: PSD1 domain-containing protein [Planctomycetes bacterium]|nr:PSD1 domain-containing protein [Planctomycetota bacterium]
MRFGHGLRIPFPFLLSVLALILFAVRVIHAAEPTVEDLEFFEKRIRPILVTHCSECHSSAGKKVQGGLLLDSRDGWMRGGDSGAVIEPGDPEKSLLILAVRQTDKDLRMPPKQKLADSQIADLETWVKNGAADPRRGESGTAGEAGHRPKYGMSLEEGRRFWSFQAVQDPAVPSVVDTTWPRQPIDNFVLARLEAAAVTPAPVADRRTLLRRVTFDLTGLPPTPDEMDAFLADESSKAFERVVDRLLESPRYGERWGRHWLDVVRYADTCGNASDYPVPQAYRYRDWVIRAFNRDLPYDQFLRQQIAGDLLPAATNAERFEHVTATGYLAIARRFGGSRMGEHHLTIEDTIDNVGRALLGSSVSCARCHDHKFDPFTMSDYYGLYGIFESTRYPFPGAEADKKQADFVPLMTPAEIDAFLAPHREQIAMLDAEIKTLEAAESQIRNLPESPERAMALATAAKDLVAARQKRTTAVAQEPVINNAYAVADGKAANTKLQLRGDPKRLGDEVPRHFPAILGGQSLPEDSTDSGRLQLAEWIADARNPLTARVMANRIWQYHFGRGIVSTPNDFGVRGQLPSHPELLDYLASRFVEHGWSIKKMHKLILLSKSWQLASLPDSNEAVAVFAENTRLDPHNDLFWKFSRYRLDAECIRDTLLFVCGDLDEAQTPAVHPFPPQHTWGWTQHNPFVANYDTRRRSVYLMQQRLKKNPFLALFDGADPSSSTGVRLPSTTPLQALFVMNDPLAHAESVKFATRVMSLGTDEASRIAAAHRLAWNRAPSSDELQASTEFLNQYRSRLVDLKTPADQVEVNAWSALARALMSSNEFVFVD